MKNMIILDSTRRRDSHQSKKECTMIKNKIDNLRKTCPISSFVLESPQTQGQLFLSTNTKRIELNDIYLYLMTRIIT